eukprot:3607557-Rhodomonas_salina.3
MGLQGGENCSELRAPSPAAAAQVWEGLTEEDRYQVLISIAPLTFEQYVAGVRNSQWADEFFIAMTSRALNATILFWQPGPDDLQPTLYPYTCTIVPAGGIPGTGGPRDQDHPLFFRNGLINFGQDHPLLYRKYCTVDSYVAFVRTSHGGRNSDDDARRALNTRQTQMLDQRPVVFLVPFQWHRTDTRTDFGPLSEYKST